MPKPPTTAPTQEHYDEQWRVKRNRAAAERKRKRQVRAARVARERRDAKRQRVQAAEEDVGDVDAMSDSALASAKGIGLDPCVPMEFISAIIEDMEGSDEIAHLSQVWAAKKVELEMKFSRGDEDPSHGWKYSSAWMEAAPRKIRRSKSCEF